MLANRFLSSATAAVFIATALSALGLAEVAAQSSRASPEVARACTGIERSIPENSVKACAQALEKSLNAKDIDFRLMKASPKLMLARLGLTEQQLEGAEIVLREGTSGSSAERITVTIRCCPLEIIVNL